MSDEVNYKENWSDEATQCKNCKLFQQENEKNVCVPENMTFEQALEKYGEVSEVAHCDYFEAK